MVFDMRTKNNPSACLSVSVAKPRVRPIAMQRIFACVGIALMPAAMGCTAGSSSLPQSPPAIDTQALLSSWADEVILPELRAFVADAARLEEKTESYANHLNQNEVQASSANTESASSPADATDNTAEGDGAQALLSDAQDAWKHAMLRWERLEIMQVGPAGMPGIMMGGLGLRDEIYSWPSVNPCGIDQQIFTNTFGTTGYFRTKLVTFYGLDALEYVLFTSSLDNACPEMATLNRENQWSQLSELVRRQRRASYAHAVSRQLLSDAQTLLSAWEREEGAFRDAFVNPGTEGSVYDNAYDVINQVFAALFYIELKVKDRKLAVPAGLHVDCASQTCPDFLESQYADISKEMVDANLDGFAALFFGNEEIENAFGFDDYLVAVGASSLSDSIRDKLAAAKAQIAQIPGSLRTQLDADPQAVVALHEAIKTLTDDVKSQMVSALNLDVPQEGAGDND